MPSDYVTFKRKSNTFKYAASSDYPNHTVLVKVTPSEKTNHLKLSCVWFKYFFGDGFLRHPLFIQQKLKRVNVLYPIVRLVYIIIECQQHPGVEVLYGFERR